MMQSLCYNERNASRICWLTITWGGSSMRTFLSSILATSLLMVGTAVGDTTDQTWMNKVELTKSGDHCVDDENCFNRYHPAIPPRANANVGDMIVLHTRDALDSEFTINSIPDDLSMIYQRLLKAKDNIAVSKVSAGTCSVCHVKFPLSTEKELMLGKEIVFCDNCGRILVII